MSSRAEPMRISLAALLGWVVPAAVLAGLVGLCPTWCLGGPEALAAMFWAGGIVLGIVLLSAFVVVFSAPGGPSRAALAFVAGGLGRLRLVPALGAWAVQEAPVPAGALGVWLAAFYVATLMAEGAWLIRALNRDARRSSLGEVRRPRRDLWDRHRIR